MEFFLIKNVFLEVLMFGNWLAIMLLCTTRTDAKFTEESLFRVDDRRICTVSCRALIHAVTNLTIKLSGCLFVLKNVA